MATRVAGATETRLAGDEEGKCTGGKGDDDGDEGGRRWPQRLKPCMRTGWVLETSHPTIIDGDTRWDSG